MGEVIASRRRHNMMKSTMAPHLTSTYEDETMDVETYDLVSDSSNFDDIQSLDEACCELEAYNKFIAVLVSELKEAMLDQGRGVLDELRAEIVNVMITQVSLYQYILCKSLSSSPGSHGLMWQTALI
jgi:hypothetical protein